MSHAFQTNALSASTAQNAAKAVTFRQQVIVQPRQSKPSKPLSDSIREHSPCRHAAPRSPRGRPPSCFGTGSRVLSHALASIKNRPKSGGASLRLVSLSRFTECIRRARNRSVRISKNRQTPR